MRAVVRSSVVLGLLAGAAVAVPATAGAGRPTPPPPIEIDWASCGPDFPGAECALVPVPLDYDNRAGGTTEIALARIPATDQANRIGTVFVNPGGPGRVRASGSCSSASAST